MITTLIAVILVVWGSIKDYDMCQKDHNIPSFQLTNYILAIGTFIFSYGGHAVFPTIQHDMLKPHHFTKSSILAFTSMIFFSNRF